LKRNAECREGGIGGRRLGDGDLYGKQAENDK